MKYSNDIIRNHFAYLLETHDIDRAIILTSIVFKSDEDKIRKICETVIKDNQHIVTIGRI